MAEGFLKSFDKNIKVVSAGTNPSSSVHPKAIEAMQQVGIDLSKNRPSHVDEFLEDNFDYVITVCGGAKESCPTFRGNVKNNLHIGFDDPAEATGTDKEIMSEFIRIRDEIKKDFLNFYKNKISNN
jgi:arsenate reductase